MQDMFGIEYEEKLKELWQLFKKSRYLNTLRLLKIKKDLVLDHPDG